MFGDERIIKDWAEFVVGLYGDSQKVIAIEEMGELIQAVTKDMRGKADLQNLSEEIGDVALTLAQLMILYSKEEPDFEKMVHLSMISKMRRTIERFLEEQNKEREEEDNGGNVDSEGLRKIERHTA